MSPYLAIVAELLTTILVATTDLCLKKRDASDSLYRDVPLQIKAMRFIIP